jgi:hypothetical protein
MAQAELPQERGARLSGGTVTLSAESQGGTQCLNDSQIEPVE